MERLPEGYELRAIDPFLYDRCLEEHFSEDLVSAFESKEEYLKLGRGFVITKDGRIVSGASSYSRYNDGFTYAAVAFGWNDLTRDHRRRKIR